MHDDKLPLNSRAKVSNEMLAVPFRNSTNWLPEEPENGSMDNIGTNLHLVDHVSYIFR